MIIDKAIGYIVFHTPYKVLLKLIGEIVSETT